MAFFTCGKKGLAGNEKSLAGNEVSGTYKATLYAGIGQ
jgi:hypothetical protein